MAVINIAQKRKLTLLNLSLAFLLIPLLLLSGPSLSLADQPQVSQAVPTSLAGTTLRVATRELPPFVARRGKDLTGFSIEVWQSLADALGVESEFEVYPNVTELLEAVRLDKADVGISAITINAEREQQLDFSQPMFSGGLQIMVRDPRLGGAKINPLKEILIAPWARFLAMGLLMGILVAHIVWLVERTHKESIISKNYFPGIFEAAWWATLGLFGQAEQMPRGPFSRGIALFWTITSVLFISYFTASFTTALTVERIEGSVQSISDLASRPVATTTGSTAAEFLRLQKVELLEFQTLDGVMGALLDGEADAVVFDSGVLNYYAAHDGRNKVQVVGRILKPEDYGIVVQRGDPLGKQIDIALLRLKESGLYQKLYDKYFTLVD
jgi:polar amino acid transport system substrate-binding protein